MVMAVCVRPCVEGRRINARRKSLPAGRELGSHLSGTPPQPPNEIPNACLKICLTVFDMSVYGDCTRQVGSQ
eukprot:3409074-Amphidinium_carterae.1